jgi:NAD(P)-dependent dehydrogenase (short-subunit alcohol dehydrogenase family)
MMDFTGQHVVITGASTGIGRATAGKIAALGGRVTLIARRSDLLEAAQRELGDGAAWAAADVGDKAQLIAALDAAVEQNGAIDGLFLNAAAEGAYAPTPDYPDEDFEQVLRVNVHSPFWAVKHVLPAMIERGRGSR